MTWLSIILALLKIVGIGVDYLQKQGLLNDARKQVLAEQFIELSQRAGVLKHVEDRISKLSDSDVDKRLSERGDFRK